MSVINYFNQAPPLKNFVVSDIRPGCFGVLASLVRRELRVPVATHVACAVAGGSDGVNKLNALDLAVAQVGPVLYIAMEAYPDEVHRALYGLGTHLTAETRNTIAANLTIDIVSPVTMDILDDNCFESLCHTASGKRLVIFDSAYRLTQRTGVDSLTAISSKLALLARTTNAAVLCIHPIYDTYAKPDLRALLRHSGWHKELTYMPDEDMRETWYSRKTKEVLSNQSLILNPFSEHKQVWCLDSHTNTYTATELITAREASSLKRRTCI